MSAHAGWINDYNGADQSVRIDHPTDADRCRLGGLVERIDAHLITPDRLAGSVIDELIADRRRRPDHQRPLTARECLHGLQFEAQIVALCAASMAAGEALPEADRKRLILAAQRVGVIVAEATR